MSTHDDSHDPHRFPGGPPRLPRLRAPRRGLPDEPAEPEAVPVEPVTEVEGTFTDYFSAESLFTGSAPAPEEPEPGEGDAYAVLGVSRQASWKEISRIHRQLVSRLHPDRYVGADDATRAAAERRVRDVNEAFAEIRRQRMPSRC